MKKIKTFLLDEKGAEMVEWILVVALIAIIAAAVFSNSGALMTAMNAGIANIANAMG
jgi:Flp pilus assembly pilin Flp